MTFNVEGFLLVVLLVGALYWAYRHGKLAGIVQQGEAHIADLKAHLEALTAKPAPSLGVAPSTTTPAPTGPVAAAPTVAQQIGARLAAIKKGL